MRIGVNVGHFAGAPPADLAARLREIDEFGFASVWFAEAYGSDVFTPLAFAAALTSRVRLGTAVAQVPARTPAATAMAATTLDHLSGGRVVLGVGASGPQVSEGWHGVPYARPLARTREYVSVLRQVLAREAPVRNDGEFFPLPSPGSELGKPLRSSLHPYRAALPVMLGAEGPRNVALSAEIADGWLAMFLAPAFDDVYRSSLDEGFAKRGGRPEGFEVVATVPVVIDDDVERAADRLRPDLALYMGGMGARGANFHHDVFVRMGYGAVAQRVQELYLDRRKDEAAAAIPTELVEQVSLIGPVSRVRRELDRWDGTVVDEIAVQGLPDDLAAVARLL
ncbi:LLM class F420-dependent oxidoreductase [Actinomycetospora sp. NBRC 106378]|uniref:LLM class F420-dependent oxidoreductase n=1 Tax=Actinomycetospora sp. NBRC 106378 TaxID=3032208 RepID=UPI0024A6073D|nr:LLM class F420-dependent oxidoreductase [Actinomycetospora sp. NBRC 106378]GLZ51303.1 LLM class F420-dependent oxidoreductase [Actinomycetospora sp. NBRC 106378]